MIVLGVDPGLQRTGYGVLEKKNHQLKVFEAGIIKTKAKDDLADRLKDIYKGISRVIEEFSPACLVLEDLYSHYKHPATAILMGHARGVIGLAASLSKINVVHYNATKVKSVITGNGHASKSQVARVVCQMLGIKKKLEPSDVTDALAMALSYFHIERK